MDLPWQRLQAVRVRLTKLLFLPRAEPILFQLWLVNLRSISSRV